MLVGADPLQNRLLSALPRDESKRLLPRLQPVSLEPKQIIFDAGGTIEHVYFPLTGVVSWLGGVTKRGNVEVATIGNEGLVGFRALLGAETSPTKVIVQVPGVALQAKTAELNTEARTGSQFLRVLHRYVNAFLTQVSQSVACNTFHSVKERFCRWLLMTHDRARSDQFPLTHALLAQMLGVRRASVSDVASKLQKAGLIRYTHGKMTIVDRAGLEAASCECYHAVQADYAHLLGRRGPSGA